MKSKPQMWGFLLFPISVFLLLTTAGFGVLYSLLTLPFKMSCKSLILRWHQYFMKMAVSIDQLGNVVLQDLFNDLLLLPNSHQRFGNEDETISSVLGKNKKNNSLSGVGKTLAQLLDRLDPNHVLDSIEQQ
mgnify:CR=1 FL=1|jgi:8-oxo-dGTP diphosphatase